MHRVTSSIIAQRQARLASQSVSYCRDPLSVCSQCPVPWKPTVAPATSIDKTLHVQATFVAASLDPNLEPDRLHGPESRRIACSPVSMANTSFHPFASLPGDDDDHSTSDLSPPRGPYPATVVARRRACISIVDDHEDVSMKITTILRNPSARSSLAF